MVHIVYIWTRGRGGVEGEGEIQINLNLEKIRKTSQCNSAQAKLALPGCIGWTDWTDWTG